MVTLSPAASADSSFEGWSGDADCADGQVTVTQNLPAPRRSICCHRDTADGVEGGIGRGTVTSAPAGIDCGADCSETYTEDTVVT